MAQESTSGSSNNNHATVTCCPVTSDPDIDNSELWASQVLIPFTRGDLTLGCIGLVSSPSRAVEFSSFFPSSSGEKIIVFKDKNIPINYITDGHRLFRSSSFHPTTTYLAWLDKIQAVKAMEKDGHFRLDSIKLSAHLIQHSYALGFFLLFQQNHQQLLLPLWKA